MANPPAFSLSETPVHLGLGATATVQPRFTGGMDWYQGYGERHGGEGVEGRLVSMHTFAEPWDSWEKHPSGAELVVCTAGRVTLIQEIEGKPRAVTLGPGEAVVNPPGVWHTADVDGPCTALFITSGLGTEHRPR